MNDTACDVKTCCEESGATQNHALCRMPSPPQTSVRGPPALGFETRFTAEAEKQRAHGNQETIRDFATATQTNGDCMSKAQNARCVTVYVLHQLESRYDRAESDRWRAHINEKHLEVGRISDSAKPHGLPYHGASRVSSHRAVHTSFEVSPFVDEGIPVLKYLGWRLVLHL